MSSFLFLFVNFFEFSSGNTEKLLNVKVEIQNNFIMWGIERVRGRLCGMVTVLL